MLLPGGGGGGGGRCLEVGFRAGYFPISMKNSNL